MYGLIGKMIIAPGKRDEFIAILVEGIGNMSGCLSYIVAKDLADENAFWITEGIIVLPHIGGPHPNRDEIVARLFVDNLGRFLDGKPLKEVVDRKVGY